MGMIACRPVEMWRWLREMYDDDDVEQSTFMSDRKCFNQLLP